MANSSGDGGDGEGDNVDVMLALLLLEDCPSERGGRRLEDVFLPRVLAIDEVKRGFKDLGFWRVKEEDDRSFLRERK